MRVVQLNGGVFGSTGKIMFGIADAIEEQGGICLCFSPITVTNRYQAPDHTYYKMGSFFSRRINVLLERITGLSGCFSVFTTARMLKRWKTFNPDIIQLHNIHGGYVNLPLLFGFARKHDIPIVWTLHDCWAFTGHCPHYTMVNCTKWRNGCHNCPQFREYPASWFDNSTLMYRLKKHWFSQIKDMTLITPSIWLAKQISSSFLKDYPVRVIHNGIDLNTFRPTPSNFRTKYSISPNTYILLGVAFGWNERKGLDVFQALAQALDADRYKIVLVGGDDSIKGKLSANIIAIQRTQNQHELSEIYTAVDLFVNPTREEVFGLVNVESLACGTPVLTFDTGGCPETITPLCGSTIPCGDIALLKKAILKISNENSYLRENCLTQAKAFDKYDKFTEYMHIYKRVVKNRD